MPGEKKRCPYKYHTGSYLFTVLGYIINSRWGCLPNEILISIILYTMDYKNIKTIEDAASAIGVKLLTEEEHTNLLGLLPGSVMARNNYLHYLLTIICIAINEGWVADWNSMEDIWEIYAYVPARLGYANCASNAGLVYLYSIIGPSSANSDYGVSLALKDKGRCSYAKDQFSALWIEYLTGIK